MATRPTGAVRSWRRAWPTVVAHQSKPLPALQSTKLDKVFTYDIVVTWGTRFTHVGTAADDGGGWWRRGSLVGFGHQRRQAPVLLRWRWRHQRGRRSSAILLGQSIWHERQHTGAEVSFTWWLGFRLLQIKIHCRTGTIYMAFCTKS
jgi:hypothetical protein